MVPGEKKGRASKRKAREPAPPQPVLAAAPPPPPPPPGLVAPPPPARVWWIGSGGSGANHSPQANQSPNPWGGYVNLLQQPQVAVSGENFHFVGLPHAFAPMSPSPPLSAQEQPSSQGTGKPSIDIDGDNDVETSRTAKRRHWSHEEEVRLASAWLNNSNDPIKGNDKKGDTFWGDITAEFNSNAAADRKRDTNQLKIHWSRLKTIISDFNGCWVKVTKLNKSGVSDDQLMDEALEMFAERYKKPFTLVHWWRTLKNQPKWCAYVAQMEKEKKQSEAPIHIDDELMT